MTLLTRTTSIGVEPIALPKLAIRLDLKKQNKYLLHVRVHNLFETFSIITQNFFKITHPTSRV